ncbi:MAG: hypothetical protein ACD_23C01384G0003 [uncultured bacterium]|nr:MAG: hypothetical protein ACD_23C01384G0003 [uncultured bacterium]
MQTWQINLNGTDLTGTGVARPLEGAKLPPEWIEPLTQGHLAAVSHVARLNLTDMASKPPRIMKEDRHCEPFDGLRTGLARQSRLFQAVMRHLHLHIEVQLLAEVIKPSIGEESRRLVFQ